MTDRESLEQEIERLEAELEEAKAEIGRQDDRLAELQDTIDNLSLQFIPNAGEDEPPFRAAVRDALDLDWSVRDERIFDELRRLKDIEHRVEAIAS